MVDLLGMVPEVEEAEEGARGWRAELREADVCDESPDSSLYMVKMGWAQSWKVSLQIAKGWALQAVRSHLDY